MSSGGDSHAARSYGYANLEMIGAVVGELSKSGSSIDQKLRQYLENVSSAPTRSNTFDKLALSPVALLEDVVAEIDEEARRAGIIRKRSGGALTFFLILLGELRTIICGKGKTPKKLGSTSQTVLTALAAAIVQKLGISNPTATAVAVLMLIALGRATKNAFCRMSDTEALKLLRDQA
jgi:hypothetical protein